MPSDPRLVVCMRPGVRRRTLCADYIAVFDPRSWKTHVVSGAAALLLTLFAERGAQRVGDLAGELGLARAGFDEPQARALVEKALSELLACDLVEFAEASAAQGG